MSNPVIAVRDSYRMVPLMEVCRAIQDGAHESPKVQYDQPGADRFIYLTSKSIRMNRIDLSGVTYVDGDFHARIYPRCQPEVGDVLLTKDGANTGNVALNTIDAPVSLLSSVCLFKTQPQVLLPGYLCYYLQSPVGLERMTGQMTGTAIKRIILKTIKATEIPLPSLIEQQRIVAILDEAFEGIAVAKANAEQNVVSARTVLDARMSEVFGGRASGSQEKRLGEVCRITSTLVDPRLDEFRNLIHVGAGNIESQTGVLSNLLTAQEEGLISGKFLFDDSMVLYSKIRPYLMKVARPDFSGLCSADMYPLAPIAGRVTRNYLYYLLLSRMFTEYAVAGSARAGMPKVNREHLFEFRAWLPPIEEQDALVAGLDALSEGVSVLESAYRRKVESLSELKKSLLNEAFSGNL